MVDEREAIRKLEALKVSAAVTRRLESNLQGEKSPRRWRAISTSTSAPFASLSLLSY
jgi:hypothetical protein